MYLIKTIKGDITKVTDSEQLYMIQVGSGLVSTRQKMQL